MSSVLYLIVVVILVAGGILYLEWKSTQPRNSLFSGLKERLDRMRGSGPFKKPRRH